MKIEIEKPIIPQFVADYIDFFKEWHGENNDGVTAITLLLNPEDSGYRGFQITRDYIDTNLGATKLIDAYRYGYTINREPLFYAKIKGTNNMPADFPLYFDIYISNAEVQSYRTIYVKSLTYPHTKSEWQVVGINDENAEFEKAEV